MIIGKEVNTNLINELLYGQAQIYFVTGGAGTGKTTLLRQLPGNQKVNTIIAALTGVAALAVKAGTIHKQFLLDHGLQLNPDDRVINNKLDETLSNCDVLVIDEISMVRADILDAIDQRLKKANGSNLPFGGKKVIFVGDLYQLPPILTKEEKEVYRKFYPSNYFFAAHCMQDIDIKVIHLQTIHRQINTEFIRLLDAVRKGKYKNEVIKCLNRKVSKNIDSLVLTPYRKKALEYNQDGLARIDSEEYQYNAAITGDFVEADFPTERVLVLKKGCRVMLLKNSQADGYHNGSTGYVSELDEKSISVLLDTGKEVNLEPASWEKYSYELNSNDNSIEKTVSGRFTQYPVKLAYALTIHKSQGLTLDKVHLDTGGRIFEHGQLYVALSRLRSPEGLSLEVPLQLTDIFQNSEIDNYYKSIL